jgi:hypothetical protein
VIPNTGPKKGGKKKKKTLNERHHIKQPASLRKQSLAHVVTESNYGVNQHTSPQRRNDLLSIQQAEAPTPSKMHAFDADI